MAETRNPSLAELNEAIAREHGIDPASIKDYKLPEKPGDEPAPEREMDPHEMVFGPRAVPAARPKVTSIATKSASCHAWSVEQMLEAMLEDIRDGKLAPTAATIIYTVENPQGGHSVHSWRAQMSWTEELAYLHIAQDQTIRHARGE